MRAWLQSPSPITVLCIALLGLGTAALYAQLLTFDFVNYDDPFLVVNNERVTAGLTAANLSWALTSGSLSNWHPLTWMSHMLDVELFGMHAEGHHATSLLLHVLNTVLLFGILRAMTGSAWKSAAVAALFSVHPLHVESVAWISTRGNILSTFFGLIALGAYVFHVRGTRFVRFIGDFQLPTSSIAALFFAFSLMAKPMWITLPFILLLLDYWPLGRMRGGPEPVRALPESVQHRLGFVALVREKLPLFAITFAGMVITYAVQYTGGNVTSSAQMPVVFRFANGIVSYVLYLGKTLWPSELTPYYPHPYLSGSGVEPFTFLQVAAAAAVLACISLAVVRLRHTRPYLLVGWLWFVGSLVPVIGFVQIAVQGMADRYTYIPLIGLFIAFVWAAGELAKRIGRFGPAMVAAPMILLIGVLSVASHKQSQHWRDGFALNRHAVEVTPNDPFMLVYYGQGLAERGDEIGAIDVYRRAMKVKPDYALAHIGLGELYSNRNDRVQALFHYRKAVSTAPHHKGFRFELGTALARFGELQEAIDAYEAVFAQEGSRNYDDPHPADVHFRLGNAYHGDGEVGKAVHHYREALKLSPERGAKLRYWIERAEREQRMASLPPSFAVRRQPEPASTPPTGF